MNPTTMWGWTLMGLTGCVNMVEMAAKADVGITQHWYDELKKQRQRLDDLVDAWEANIEDER